MLCSAKFDVATRQVRISPRSKTRKKERWFQLSFLWANVVREPDPLFAHNSDKYNCYASRAPEDEKWKINQGNPCVMIYCTRYVTMNNFLIPSEKQLSVTRIGFRCVWKQSTQSNPVLLYTADVDVWNAIPFCKLCQPYGNVMARIRGWEWKTYSSSVTMNHYSSNVTSFYHKSPTNRADKTKEHITIIICVVRWDDWFSSGNENLRGNGIQWAEKPNLTLSSNGK